MDAVRHRLGYVYMGRAESNNGRSRLLMRGESVVASTGLAMAAIVLVAIACAGAWTVFSQRTADRSRVRQDLQDLSQLLGRSIEPLLSEGSLSAARSIIVGTATEHGMTE